MQRNLRTKGGLVAVLMLVGGMAWASSPSSLSQTTPPEPPAPSSPPSAYYPGDGPVGKDAPLHIDALDFFFEGVPPSNHPGVKPVTFRNRSDHETHEISVFKLVDQNATINQAVSAANQFGEGGLVENGFATRSVGGLNIGPNSTLEGSLDLSEPGGYVYYCFVQTHGGHWNYGMVGKILISLPAAPAA